jgi:hypothetical protein
VARRQCHLVHIGGIHAVISSRRKRDLLDTLDRVGNLSMTPSSRDGHERHCSHRRAEIAVRIRPPSQMQTLLSCR